VADKKSFPCFKHTRAKTRENGAFCGSRPAKMQENQLVSEIQIDKSIFVGIPVGKENRETVLN
jgi:hypothetical protein